VNKSDGVASQSKIEAVIYKYSSKEETDLPFTMNIWNAKSSSGTHSLTIEVEWNNECDIEYPPLEQIEISIPLHDQPQIEQLENSTLKTKDDGYCWVIESLSEEDPSSVIKLTTTTPE
jgi:hypothetical protein